MPIPSLNSSLNPRSRPSTRGKNASGALRLQFPDGSETNTIPPQSRDMNPPSALGAPSIPLSRQSNADQTKRRSFLPQRGDVSALTRKIGPGTATSNQNRSDSTNSIATDASIPLESADTNALKTRLRPKSIHNTSASVKHAFERINLRTESLHPTDAEVEVATSRVSGLGPSHSLRKPSTSAQLEQSINARSHLRTKSTSTARSIQQDVAEPRSRLDRPKSLYATTSFSLKNTGSTSANAVSRDASGSVRHTALKRSVSIKARPEEPKKEEPKKPRPAFSTLQQHFTPRKVGKAPTSTFLHPPASDVSPNCLSPDIAKLQAELLQLHFLLESSVEVSSQWELSAKRILHRRFDEVASLHDALRENERQSQEQKNVYALREWNSVGSSFGLVDHIRILSGPLHELPSLLNPGGRFVRLADEFDLWINRIEDAWIARKGDPRQQGCGEFAKGLGDFWREETAALTRKLTIFSRDMDRLTDPAGGSSVECIVATCKQLLGLVLDALHEMQMIEAAVVSREREYVELRLKAIAGDFRQDVDEINQGKAAWQV
ncbi:hypothetical protein CC78DRAFT_573466 [Lojkania enalia]|uniref:Uncharacterized protein n=1 Tax=Lojkania enalia TaxID=147567 RepID=A0A9P4TRX3_9PLEO|nr:hypothetical protein CC78DRAFT_573466 [Didymosphaeria enalia]